MIENLDELIARYRKAGILVDTNLLLLLFMGNFQPARITTFKRTQQFVEEDFQLLMLLLGYFDKIITTPNILTEVSNLSGQLEGNLKLAYFLSMVNIIGGLEEEFTPHPAAARNSFRPKLTSLCNRDSSRRCGCATSMTSSPLIANGEGVGELPLGNTTRVCTLWIDGYWHCPFGARTVSRADR